MKFIPFLLVIFSFFAGSAAFAQWTDPAALTSTTMKDIFETAEKKISELEDQRNQEVVNVTFDLLVNQGKKTVWRYLDPSFDYDVLVMGDRRAENIKLSVYKKNSQSGEWAFVDEFNSDNPQIRLDPAEFEQYEFTVSVDRFRPGDSTCHFVLILYHQNPERGR